MRARRTTGLRVAISANAHSQLDGASFAPLTFWASTIASVRSSADMACCWSSMRVIASRNHAPSARGSVGSARCTTLGEPGHARGTLGERLAQVGEAAVGFGDAPQPGQRLAHHAVATAADDVRAAHERAPRPACWLTQRTWPPNRLGLAAGVGELRRRERLIGARAPGTARSRPARRPPSGPRSAASGPRRRRASSRGRRRSDRPPRPSPRRGTCGGGGRAPSTPRPCSTSIRLRPQAERGRVYCASTAPDGSVFATRKRPSRRSRSSFVVSPVGSRRSIEPGREQRRAAGRRPAVVGQRRSSRRARRGGRGPTRAAVGASPAHRCRPPAAWYRPMTAPAWRTTL